MENLASITIKLPEGNLEQSGFYYFILKQLAWADIPLQEIISTTNEMTIVVKEKDINQTVCYSDGYEEIMHNVKK